MTTASAHERLLGSLRSRATHPAVVWNGRSFTFEEMRRIAALYLDRLSALGVRRGDRVAVFAETCPELVAAFVGHLMSGVIHVPINTRYKADEARHILENSGAVAVLCGAAEEECTGVLEEILRRCPAHLKHVIALREAFPADQPPAAAALPPGSSAPALPLPSSPSKKSSSSSFSPLPPPTTTSRC